MPYKKSISLVNPVGNNAFSYDIRTSKELFIPSIIDGSFDDIRISQEIVFEDIDETGVLRSCSGLEHFVRMSWHDTPMIVCDNHNHVLYFWYEALANGTISHGSTLVHIDEHSDLWGNENDLLDPADLEWVARFTNERCNVGNYIQPAIREGIIGKMLRIEWSGDMEKYASYEPAGDESLILNLDLDFFAPELDYIPFADKKWFILHFARRAKLITVATSPFFIDQERAIAMFRRVFEE